jgi:peptidoglycan/LPS O-acetylase OafA/YrhL
VSYAINSTYWFVAVEAQLYLAFPVFAAVWKRHGGIPALLLGVSVFAVAWLLAGGGTLFARPQLLLVFLLGMAAARVVSHANVRPKSARLSGSASLAVIFVASCAFVWAYLNAGRDEGGLPIAALVRDLSSGTVAAAALIVLSVPGREFLKRPLSARVFALLAPYAYAAYLAHDIFLRFLKTFLVAEFGLSRGPLFLAMLAAALPVVGAAAWLLHRFAERPFLPKTA